MGNIDTAPCIRNRIYLYLADAQYHQEDYEGCLETCNTLLEGSREKDGYFLRGSAYLHLKEYSQAEEDFSRVIEGSEDYQDYLDIFMVYRECGLNADGSGYLEQAAEIRPGDGEDYYHRGRVYYYLGDYENAENDLKEAVERDYPMAQIYLGKLYFAAGDREKAREAYESRSLQRDGLLQYSGRRLRIGSVLCPGRSERGRQRGAAGSSV